MLELFDYDELKLALVIGRQGMYTKFLIDGLVETDSSYVWAYMVRKFQETIA